MSKPKKTFDCVQMKRRAQERIYEETRNFTPEEEIEHFRRKAADFWKRLEERKQGSSAD